MGSQNMSAKLVVTPGSGVNPHYFSDGNNTAPWLELGMTEQQAKEYLGAVSGILAHPNAVVDLRITGAFEYFDALDAQLARAVAGEVTSQAGAGPGREGLERNHRPPGPRSAEEAVPAAVGPADAVTPLVSSCR